MKSYESRIVFERVCVTLCVRVWIEMARGIVVMILKNVTLCVRVWIEISG